MPYFYALAHNEDPGVQALQDFIRAVQRLLGDILDGTLLEPADRDVEPPPLFMEFREEAMVVFDEHVLRSFDDLHRHIPEIHPRHIDAHGLVGPPQRFKFRVLGGIEAARRQFRNIWEWLKAVLGQVDHILESIIDAAAASTGTPHGGLIVEFKDTLLGTLSVGRP